MSGEKGPERIFREFSPEGAKTEFTTRGKGADDEKFTRRDIPSQ